MLARGGHNAWQAARALPDLEKDGYVKLIPPLVLILALLALAGGCGKDLSKESDAELGLNAQQAAGRAVFNAYCAACHTAYSSSGLKGPGLKNLFRRQYLPSGLPADDRFVEQTIVGGRGMMPAQGDALTDEQLRDLMAYLHTL